MSLNERNVTMKVSDKQLNAFGLAKQKVQKSFQWIILKKVRPLKKKYIALPPRE